MFRNILHSRRVNKARRRLMALLPPQWVTVPTFALRTSTRSGALTYTNEALDLFDESTLIELFTSFRETEHDPDSCFKDGECLAPDGLLRTSLTSTKPSSVSDVEWKPDCCTVEGVPDGVSLSQILHILMKSLEPESIFALDSVLRSSVLSGSQLPCWNGERSECVFVTNMCIWADHIYAVRVKHHGTSRFSRLLPTAEFDRSSKPVCPCLLMQPAIPGSKSTGLGVEPKVSECSGPDTDSSRKPCVVLFDPLLAVCKAWRWPDLSSGDWIRRLNLCEAAQHGVVNRLCINPHHWSRVILTDGTPNSSHRPCTTSADLRFENDPDLMCVGLAAIQAVRLCHCRSTSSSFDVVQVPQSGQSLRTGPIAPAPAVSEKPCESPVLSSSSSSSSGVNVTLCPPALCTAPCSPSTFTSTWHSDTSVAYGLPDHNPCGLRHSTSIKSQLLHSVLGGTAPVGGEIANSSSTSSGEADCVTDSTELADSTIGLSERNVRDCHRFAPFKSPQTARHHSSTSTSGTDEFSTRSKPKKPRPLSPNNCDPRPPVPLRSTTPTAAKPWAKLSFWEETRHVGQSWFSLTAPLVRVIYDVAEKENDSQLKLSDVSTLGPDLQQPFRRRRRGGGGGGGGDVRCLTDSRGAHCIRLSRLVNHHRCNLSSSSSSMFKLNTSWVLPPQLCRFTSCTDHSPTALDKLTTATTQGPRFSSSRSVLPSFAKRSSSWRQIYRLGSQGIAFHLSPTGRIWIDNQTLAANLPLFVSSSYFIRNAASYPSDWPVYRVPAGCSILVFDQLAYQNARPAASTAGGDSVRSERALPAVHHHAPVVHVSLGKGWGRSYRRPDLTHCPARLELWINVEHLCTVAARSA